MDTSNIKIDLVNYELGFSSPPRLVQGYSSKSYGLARFSPKYNAHVLTLSLEDYNKAAKDLSKAWHQSLRRWVPIVVVEEASDTAEQPKKPVVAKVTPQVPATQSVTVTHQPESKQPVVEIPAELPTKYFGLTTLAQKLGIDPEKYKGDKQGLIEAIESKRLQPA